MLTSRSIEIRKQIAIVLLKEGAIPLKKYCSTMKCVRDFSKSLSKIKMSKEGYYERAYQWRKSNKIIHCIECGANLEEYGPMHHCLCDFCWKARKSLGIPTNPRARLILHVFPN